MRATFFVLLICAAETKRLDEAAEKDNGISMEVQMAWMANASYNLTKEGYGWTLNQEIDLGGSFKEGKGTKVGLYQQGKKCVVAFSGTQNGLDWKNNFQVAKIDVPECGIEGAHSGFVTHFKEIIDHHHWRLVFRGFLMEKCSDGVHVTGHSLGGAVASIFAACANVESVDREKADIPVTVSSVYTFGAPHVSQVALSNKQAPNGVFNGARVYNNDQEPRGFDLVPWIAWHAGFFLHLLHPKMKAIEYDCKGVNDFSLCVKHEHSAEDEKTKYVPKFDVSLWSASVALHNMEVYLNRTKTLSQTDSALNHAVST